MPSALVTGVGGQDGHYMSQLLLAKGYQVTGCVRPAATHPEIDGMRIIEIDLRDDEAVEQAVVEASPDEIYNFAGISSLAEAHEDPQRCWDVNARGLHRLLSAASPETRICQASSALIFGPPDGVTRDEDSPIAPSGPYAEAKAEAHGMVEGARRDGRFAVSAILFNHESPLRSTRFVTRRVTRGVAEVVSAKRTTVEVDNLGSVRDWGFAGDYVRAMWLMLQQAIPQDLVIATGIQHSVKDLVRVAFAAAGVDEWTPRVNFARDDAEPWSPADPSRARETLGWQPEVDFESLIRMMVHHDQKNV